MGASERKRGQKGEGRGVKIKMEMKQGQRGEGERGEGNDGIQLQMSAPHSKPVLHLLVRNKAGGYSRQVLQIFFFQ